MLFTGVLRHMAFLCRAVTLALLRKGRRLETGAWDGVHLGGFETRLVLRRPTNIVVIWGNGSVEGFQTPKNFQRSKRKTIELSSVERVGYKYGKRFPHAGRFFQGRLEIRPVRLGP